MSDPIEFEYVNNSLTTMMAQHRLISKIASYFKIPGKLMREMLDKDELELSGLVTFSGDNAPLNDGFFATNLKLNIAELLNPKKFAKSKLVQAYILMNASEARGGYFTALSDSELFVMVPCDEGVWEGGGAIYLNYEVPFQGQLIMPIETFLKDRYPLPTD